MLMMDSGRRGGVQESLGGCGGVRKMDDGGAALGDLTNVDKAEKKHDDAAVKEKGVAEGYDFTCGILEVDEKGGRVMAVAPGVGLRELAFDAVYSDRATQLDVYEQSARALVADVINGINATIVVYGQTGRR